MRKLLRTGMGAWGHGGMGEAMRFFLCSFFLNIRSYLTDRERTKAFSPLPLCPSAPMLLLILLLGWAVPRESDAREIYRLGGEEHPWDTSWNRTGSINLVDFSGGHLQPVLLDSTENLSLGYKERGGSVRSGSATAWTDERINALFDGDETTAMHQEFQARFAGTLSADQPFIDLGGRFPVNRIRFYPRPTHPERFLDQFEMHISSGQKSSDVSAGVFHWDKSTGAPVWKKIDARRENTDVVVDIRFPTQLVQHVQLRPYQNKEWEVAELEIYGGGFVKHASYTSDILDLGELASWGEIRWSGERASNANVQIRTRTGANEDPNIYWRKTGQGGRETTLGHDGEPLTRKTYEQLNTLEQGGITYDTDNWSFWSSPYNFEVGVNGTRIVSPGPRRYIQIQMSFLSTATDGALLDELWFEFSRPPAAQNVIAEIWPIEVEAGRTTTFTYALKPTIRAEDTGFDGIEITAPTGVETVRAVRIGGREAPFTVETRVDPPRTEIHLSEDRIDREASGQVLEIIFDARVLRYGTVFELRVFDSGREDVPQLVNPGNVLDELPGDDIAVRTTLGEDLLVVEEILPNPFTPNGDGINDEARIVYSLLKLTGDAPLEAGIYDIGGRRVRELHTGTQTSGQYTQVWDGQDDQGALVPPGLYIYRISVHADDTWERRGGVLCVSY